MKALGIILAGGGSSRLGDLSKKRAVAAMPIAGSYRCIDFALSSMSNSHVQKVAVFTQYNARSLNQHLSSSKWWDFGRKQGGLFLLTPTVTTTNDSWFRGTADAMCQNIDFLRDSHEPYVVISSGDCVYKADLGKMLQYHIDKNADITIAYTQIDNTLDNPARFGVLTLDKDNKILSLDEKPAEASGNIVNTGIYIMRRRFLIELLNRADKEGRYNLVQDIIVPLIVIFNMGDLLRFVPKSIRRNNRRFMVFKVAAVLFSTAVSMAVFLILSSTRMPPQNYRDATMLSRPEGSVNQVLVGLKVLVEAFQVPAVRLPQLYRVNGIWTPEVSPPTEVGITITSSR